MPSNQQFELPLTATKSFHRTALSGRLEVRARTPPNPTVASTHLTSVPPSVMPMVWRRSNQHCSAVHNITSARGLLS